MFSHAGAVSVLCLATAASAAVPAIDSIQVERRVSDFVLTWTAPPLPVDGYRVYRSHEVDCSAPVLVYEGPATTYTDVAAFADDIPSLYRVAAVVAGQEGPLTTPAYEFSPTHFSGPGMDWDELLAVPYDAGVADPKKLCRWVNGQLLTDPPIGNPVTQVWQLSPTTAVFSSQSCSSPAAIPPYYTLVPGHAYGMKYPDGTRAKLIGHGHPTWQVGLSEVRSTDPGGNIRGRYLISLPYDHAYPDLATLAAEIPNAVEVTIKDVRDGTSPDGFVGLTRPSSSAPWTGTNRVLTDRRGHGVRAAVDVPATWAPRRLCGHALLPDRIPDLMAVKSGDDVKLTWTDQAAAAGGHRVVRRNQPALLLVPPALPVHATAPAGQPVFVDPGAGTGPDALLAYQVAGQTADGWLGGF